MKIGVIHPNQRCGGGGERISAYFVNYLLDKGYDVTVFSENGKLAYKNIYAKKPKIRTPFMKIPGFLLRGEKFKTYKFSLSYRFFDYSGFDILVDTLGKSILNSLVHHVKLHYFHISPVKNGLYFLPKRIIDKIAVKANRVTNFVAMTKRTQLDLKKYLGIESTVVYPPVDTNRFTPTRNPSKDFVLMSGRYARYKRFEVALKYLKGEKVVIAAVLSDPSYYKELKKKFPLVDFRVNVGDKKLIKLYQNCKAYIFTQSAPFGLVPFEAMACGRPAIVPEGSGASELIEDGVNGFVVKDDFSNFPQKFKQLINSNINKNILRKIVIDKLSVDVFGSKMEELMLND